MLLAQEATVSDLRVTHFTDELRLPLIDLSLFDMGNPWRDQVAAQIDRAAAEFGFFRVINHGIDPGLIDSLLSLSRRLFAGEIAAAEPPGLREAVRDYTREVKGLAHRLMTSFARGLHLGDPYFVDRYTGDAVSRFRIVSSSGLVEPEGLGPMLTLLQHDDLASLRVTHAGREIDVPHLPGALACAVGPSLSQLSGGRYASARCRLMSAPGRRAVSLPFYFGVAGEASVAMEESARAA